jgi:capsular exopolysaccharide synthesis family protein
MEKIDTEKSFELKDYWLIIAKRKWYVMIFFLAIVIGTFIFSFMQKNIYKATCTVIIEKENPQVLNFQELYPLERTKWEYYETQYQIIKSRSIMEKTVKKLGLDKKEGGLQRAIQKFTRSLKVEPKDGSALVMISITGENATQITKAVNTLAEVYIENNMEIKHKTYNDTAKWFKKQLPALKVKLEKSELALQLYKEKQGIVSFEDKQSIIMDELKKINSDYISIKTERIAMQTVIDRLNKLSRDPKELESFPYILKDDLTKKLKQQYIALETELNRISKLYKQKHPEIVSREYQLAQLRKRIDEEIQNIIMRIRSEYNMLLAKERELKKALEQQNVKALELQDKTIQYSVLKREADINREIYHSVLNRSKETELTKMLETNNIKLVDRAIKPKAPIKPNKKKNIFIAIIFGLLGGVSLAFFIEYIDKSIKSAYDVEFHLNLPTIEIIPSFKSSSQLTKGSASGLHEQKVRDKKEDYNIKNSLITITEPTSIASEAYRSLRTKLLYFSNENKINSLLISSAVVDEGKSTITANLGVILTYLKQKILIIDADFRKPTLHKIFEVENSKGLIDFLENQSKYKEIIQQTQINNLDIITSGGKSAKSAELLDSNLMRNLIKDMSKIYNLIFIDSTIATTLPDAIILASMVNAVMLVHKPGSSDRNLLKHVKKRFLDVGAKILGVILNNIDLHKQSGYFHSYSYYNHYLKNIEKEAEHK